MLITQSEGCGRQFHFVSPALMWKVWLQFIHWLRLLSIRGKSGCIRPLDVMCAPLSLKLLFFFSILRLFSTIKIQECLWHVAVATNAEVDVVNGCSLVVRRGSKRVHIHAKIFSCKSKNLYHCRAQRRKICTLLGCKKIVQFSFRRQRLVLQISRGRSLKRREFNYLFWACQCADLSPLRPAVTYRHQIKT